MIFSISAATAFSTVTSDEPFERNTPKFVAGRPLSFEMPRISATLSRTSAMSESRAMRPPRRMMFVSASCSAVFAPPSTRIACSPPPTCARPPGTSRLSVRSCAFTSTAVMPSACMRAGSSSMRISRLTPPPRDTCATPSMPSRRLVTVLSTNQDSSSSVIAVVLTA